MRSQWQIDQGKACGCRGHDEWCGCQNVNRSESVSIETWPAMRKRQYEERGKLVVSALKAAGSILGAAQMLDIDRGQLYREMKERGISREMAETETES